MLVAMGSVKEAQLKAVVEAASVAGELRLRVKVVPGASRTKVMGVLGDRLKIAVAAPPEAGQANAAVVAVLARVLQLSERAVMIVAGHTQPRKLVAVRGLSVEEFVVRVGRG
jgi:uncharacterized protein (TIGR00251 family)